MTVFCQPKMLPKRDFTAFTPEDAMENIMIEKETHDNHSEVEQKIGTGKYKIV